jgi:hypothetical protein
MSMLDRTRVVIGRDPTRAEIVSVLIKRSYRLEPAKGIVEQIEAPHWVTAPVLRHFDDRLGTELVHEYELFPWKSCVDVIVRGSIVSPGGRATRSMQARVMVGHVMKDAQVLGDRWVHRSRFTEPEPFETLPLEWSRAYGGVDASGIRPSEHVSEPSYEHPGAYPRNPVGVGWAIGCSLGSLEGEPLPNFEDPQRRLTPENLVIGDATRWSWAPEPRGFGWLHRGWYPRCTFLGLLPVFLPADDSPKLAEVASGWMPRRLSRWLRELGPGMPVHPRFYNGASAGMRLPNLDGNEPVMLDGFFARGAVSFDLPGHRPRVTVGTGRERLSAEVVAHTLEIEPSERRVTLIWAGRARTGSQQRIQLLGLEATEREVFEQLAVEVDGRAVQHEAERSDTP